MGKLEWNAEQVEKNTQKKLQTNMKRAMLFAEGQAKKKVSRGNLDGDNPSLPGEPPKVVTGVLRANIGHSTRTQGMDVIGALGVKNGPANRYAMRLELGFTGTDSMGRTYNQLPRPFLQPTIDDNRAKILEILQGG